jgi:hypothetical protein
MVPIRSAKTIYVRFDLNDYSIPPNAVRRPLTLVASDTWFVSWTEPRRSPATAAATTATNRCWIRIINRRC